MRAGRIKRVHKPAMIRSPARRLGARLRPAIQDQKLMPDKDRFSDHATKPAGLCQPDHGDDQIKQEIEEVAHPGNRNKTRTAPDFPPSLEFAMDRIEFTPVEYAATLDLFLASYCGEC